MPLLSWNLVVMAQDSLEKAYHPHKLVALDGGRRKNRKLTMVRQLPNFSNKANQLPIDDSMLARYFIAQKREIFKSSKIPPSSPKSPKKRTTKVARTLEESPDDGEGAVAKRSLETKLSPCKENLPTNCSSSCTPVEGAELDLGLSPTKKQDRHHVNAELRPGQRYLSPPWEIDGQLVGDIVLATPENLSGIDPIPEAFAEPTDVVMNVAELWGVETVKSTSGDQTVIKHAPKIGGPNLAASNIGNVSRFFPLAVQPRLDDGGCEQEASMHMEENSTLPGIGRLSSDILPTFAELPCFLAPIGAVSPKPSSMNPDNFNYKLLGPQPFLNMAICNNYRDQDAYSSHWPSDDIGGPFDGIERLQVASMCDTEAHASHESYLEHIQYTDQSTVNPAEATGDRVLDSEPQGFGLNGVRFWQESRVDCPFPDADILTSRYFAPFDERGYHHTALESLSIKDETQSHMMETSHSSYFGSLEKRRTSQEFIQDDFQSEVIHNDISRMAHGNQSAHEEDGLTYPLLVHQGEEQCQEEISEYNYSAAKVHDQCSRTPRPGYFLDAEEDPVYSFSEGRALLFGLQKPLDTSRPFIDGDFAQKLWSRG